MEKKEKRPGYFARLKKRRQLKQSQPEKLASEQDQSSPSLKAAIISEHGPAGELQEKGQKEEREKGSQSRNGDSRTDDRCNSQAKREKKRPPCTVEYTVKPQDTLNSIALKFNITPNKLVQLNCLFSRSVVTGQKLFVPDGAQSETGSQVNRSAGRESNEKEKDGESAGRAGKPLRRELSPPSEDESPATVKFIKMSCKYFTDGMGVVGGVMIVTPNNIMFDPHKSDPLVIENGCEEYGLICPMEEVVSVALYDDVSRMKLKDALPSDIPQDLCPLYRPGEWEELPSERDLNPFSRYEAMNPVKRPIVLDDMKPGICSVGDKSSPSDEGFTELEPVLSEMDFQQELAEMVSPKEQWGTDEEKDALVESETSKENNEDVGLRSAFSEGTSSALVVSSDTSTKPSQREDADSTESQQAKENHVSVLSSSEGESFVMLTEVLEDQNGKSVHDGTKGDSDQSSSLGPVDDRTVLTNQKSNCEERKLSAEERRKQNSEDEMKSWLLSKIQGPIESMLLSSEEKSKTPPMFLCFKVGRPMRKSFITARTSSPVHSFGGRVKQLEYWFAVPQERVDHLYSFFIQWSPDVYGKDAREQGFVVVEKDELNMIDNFFSDPGSRSWEIITINEAKRRQSFGSFEDEEPLDLLPVLSDSSALMEDTHIEKLAARLPARAQGYPWRLAYSTVVHGTSLKTLYRNLADLDCPVLLVIKDKDNQVFGAFSTHPFRVSEHFYGTGETFLYSFCPEIKVFRWTGDNSYFVKGNTDSLQMGGGSGHFGLWLDADLYHGTTSTCSTFNNQPLSAQQDFIIQSLEVWAFE
ncbi:nuclear receptor coactivator 7 isoform X1 [Denticeps clupeoides]|uniref:Nuclear receptor coactivator 7 n=1 Tax=Denticeps clupeoides TaxID=299321 RepID=A0AAY4B3B9_9TELE|nr:nuclear receptor coactivator 7-like isoform X1 [Denticeps clupeoides]XP_028809104.1 nuclear receptor coactivator 7-like isoform X1 [Denticeps clupeoides]XP_028809105.1 nuclear receptor coactivator 7-like isoform X1 [Denticeps clupeoides]